MLYFFPAWTFLTERPQFYESSYATRDFAQVGLSKEISLCRVKSAFNGCSIKWYKDGKPIEESTQRIFFVNERQILTISEVKESDEGLYSCTVSNGKFEISRNLTMETYGKLWSFGGYCFEGKFLNHNDMKVNLRYETIIALNHSSTRVSIKCGLQVIIEG